MLSHIVSRVAATGWFGYCWVRVNGSSPPPTGSTQPRSPQDGASALLEAAYDALDFRGGDLLTAIDTPSTNSTDWVARGGWLALAKKLGVEKVLFVGDNPIIVFARVERQGVDWRQLFNQVWCMARPPLLFLARPGELDVLDLTQAPVRDESDVDARRLRVRDVARTVKEVYEKLQAYHRSKIESGELFEEHRFGFENRADRALIRDLGKVRNALLDDGLSVEHAHGLIGRAVFVRYLEDRGILTEEYFRRVAGTNTQWNRIIDEAPVHNVRSEERLFFSAVLDNKLFTDSLFRQLAADFNGDLFPFDPAERTAFTASRLRLLRRFLLGEINDPGLFFFAYDFQIIPIELISSMYEEFLRIEKGRTGTQASFYTPASLVEFVLSQTLSADVLSRRPRVVDPACGSAIFLVEAFRRIVRHRVVELGRRLRPVELRKILREQIGGIDVNPEAIRVAAFSLYLALLHYLEPPDILSHRLPSLTCSEGREDSESSQQFNILLSANSFDLADLSLGIQGRFGTASADVVVGNPPWGEPSEQDEATQEAAIKIADWLSTRQRQTGDKELSQAFVHLVIDQLRPGGRAGLLISTGVFFKRHKNSQQFREQWLRNVALERVVNFGAVRHVFFTGRGREDGAIAPFASVVFEKQPIESDHRFEYYSVKETAVVDRLQVVALRKPDLHLVGQSEVLADEELWKVYWWGGHRDQSLLHALRLETTLGEFVDPSSNHPEWFGEGFKECRSGRKTSTVLANYRELPTRKFHRYGSLDSSSLVDAPSDVERARNPVIYDGCRLLIKRGITQKGQVHGRIIARLETQPFCFRNSIFGLRLHDDAERNAEIILGIVWSSLTRYYAWLTSGSWGMWHHELKKETIAKFPVRLPDDSKLRARILGIVRKLRSFETVQPSLFGKPTRTHVRTVEIEDLESKLDDAVFDLFELSEAERDLIRDMCDIGLPFFYEGMRSSAVKRVPIDSGTPLSGTDADLASERGEQSILGGYLKAFLELWDRELAPEGRFRWRVVLPKSEPSMLALIFVPESPTTQRVESSEDDIWAGLVRDVKRWSAYPFHSHRVYIDGLLRVVAENRIIIIKQNEQRLWTRTAAREDAEATLLWAMRKQQTLADHQG